MERKPIALGIGCEQRPIEVAVDVRRIPQSRTKPQFNRDTLRDALATVHIGCRFKQRA